MLFVNICKPACIFIQDSQKETGATGRWTDITAQYPSQHTPDIPTERDSPRTPSWTLCRTPTPATSCLSIIGAQCPQWYPCHISYGHLWYELNYFFYDAFRQFVIIIVVACRFKSCDGGLTLTTGQIQSDFSGCHWSYCC